MNSEKGVFKILCSKPEISWFLESYFGFECDVITDPSNLFHINEYQLIIFGDQHRNFFDREPRALAALTDGIRLGTPALFFGGWNSYGSGGYIDSPLAELLPIEMQINDFQYVDERNCQRHSLQTSVDAKYFSRNLIDQGIVLPNSCHKILAIKPGAKKLVAVCCNEQDSQTGEPIVIYRGHKNLKILCLTIPLRGGGARNFFTSSYYPSFLLTCIQELCGAKVSTSFTNTNSRGHEFRNFLNNYRLAGKETQNELLELALNNLWFDKHENAQIRFLGELAALAQSRLLPFSRLKLLSKDKSNTLQYFEDEADMYKYSAFVALDQNKLKEAGALFEITYHKQNKLENFEKKQKTAWPFYFLGMLKLCNILDALAHNLPLDAILDDCKVAVKNFEKCEQSGFPSKKLQVKYVVILILQIITQNQKASPFHKKIESKTELNTLAMNIEIFGQTYADDIPNLTSPNLINHLVEIANSLTQVQKTTPMTMSRFEFPEAELWKYNVLLRIQDIMKDTSYKRDFLFWLESKMKILKIVVPLSSIIFGLLTQQAVQGWINQNATQILSWVSGSTSLIGFVLAIIIWVRHRFQKTKEKA